MNMKRNSRVTERHNGENVANLALLVSLNLYTSSPIVARGVYNNLGKYSRISSSRIQGQCCQKSTQFI